jgi:hypothetical protein
MRKVILAAVVLLLTGCPAVWAASTLHIGTGAGTKCAQGCGGDPNNLRTATQADVYQTSGGASTLSQPLLVIIGAPNDSHVPAQSFITSALAINSYPTGTITPASVAVATAGTYGLIAPVSGAFFGEMQPGQEAYSFLGLQGANNSNSFTNWSASDATLAHVTATSYGIYVYAITGDLGSHGLINLALWEQVPKGSFIVAYGEDANGKVFDTPFTEAGVKTAYYHD